MCPSGLSGQLRPMKVSEERILADRKLAKLGGQVDQLLSACWEQTLETGPYDFGHKDIDWRQVLQGDRFYALLQLRALTYGPAYAFSVNCQACRSRIEWELDLTELPPKSLSQESQANFVSGNRFSTTLPNGPTVWFSLLTGAEEQKLSRVRKQAGDEVLSKLLAFRIIEIEGVKPEEKKSFLNEMTLQQATYLLSTFDEVDCGVETTIEIECPECLAQQEVELPFDANFFIPKARPRSSQKSI